MEVQPKVLCRLLAAVLFFAATLNLSAQGTAFSYQGQLSVSGTPANTNYDFRFAVFDTPINGNMLSFWVTNFDTPVSNGLFTVKLDFGPGVFNGTDNGSNDWLDVAVRAIGVTNFTELMPRQPILPVPYAQFANSASNLLGSLQAAQLVGNVSGGLLSGAYSNGVSFLNGSNSFAGTFSGNGGGLTNLNASSLVTGTVADALLPGDVAFLGHNQVFTGSNSFTGPSTFSGSGTYSGVNTFNNNNNSFTGNFFGNGLVGWVAESGTTVSASRDTGYMLLNSSLTTLTLPASGSLTQVDIVRISEAGTGGFIVKGNAGQFITGTFASYGNCTLQTLPSGLDYHGVAASGDGVRMYGAGVSGFNGILYSSDSGQNWSPAGSLSGSWNSVACSQNGLIVYAQPTSGVIQKSTNGGLTWAVTTTGTTGSAISCTADGSMLLTGNVFCSGNGTYRVKAGNGSISNSINSGSTWTHLTAPAAGVSCVAASSDCTRLVAAVTNGLLYASSNMGVSWTALSATNQAWSGVWMSPDGSKIAATVSTTGGTITGSIYYCNVIPEPNTTSANGIVGSQGSAVELQYIGGNQFIPVGSSGLLWAN